MTQPTPLPYPRPEPGNPFPSPMPPPTEWAGARYRVEHLDHAGRVDHGTVAVVHDPVTRAAWEALGPRYRAVPIETDPVPVVSDADLADAYLAALMGGGA